MANDLLIIIFAATASLSLLHLFLHRLHRSLKARELNEYKRIFEQTFPGRCGECSWARYQSERGWAVDPVTPHRCPEAQREARQR